MISKCFMADDASLDEVLEFVEAELEKAECPLNLITSVCVAIEEVFVNIAHYAYNDDDGEVCMSIDFNENSRTFRFVVSDRGIPFDPLKRPDPDVSVPPEDRQIGGLGIFIAKRTMDSIAYSFENGENILVMTKRLP